VAALSHLGVKKIALATPYPPELSQLLIPFFESCGFEVTEVRNMPMSDLREVGRAPPEVAYRLGRDLRGVESELICIMATDFRTAEAIEALEQDLAKPVISTNQAILWQALRIAGVNEGISGYGRLLSNT
jgi:arylmalonate decarboxylase